MVDYAEEFRKAEVSGRTLVEAQVLIDWAGTLEGEDSLIMLARAAMPLEFAQSSYKAREIKSKLFGSSEDRDAFEERFLTADDDTLPVLDLWCAARLFRCRGEAFDRRVISLLAKRSERPGGLDDSRMELLVDALSYTFINRTNELLPITQFRGLLEWWGKPFEKSGYLHALRRVYGTDLMGVFRTKSFCAVI